MKKAVKILLAILMVACLALTVMACNKECKPGEHQWKDVRTIKVASCKEEGSKEVECEKCGKTDTQPIAKLAHTPQDVEKEDATCGEAGHQAGTRCSVCGETISGMEVIEATGNHTFVYTKESYDDTQHWKVCSVCGAQDTKANHQFDDHLKCECGATDVANAVARINGVKYRSVAAAVTEATAGQTIVLLKNATLDEVINIEKAVTIDLNGKNVTKSANNGAMFVVGQNGKLTIKGEGNVTHSGPCEVGSSNYIVNAISNGEVIIEGGTYEVLDCTIVQVSETAKVAIKGGHFAINENCSWRSTYLINKKDGSGTTVAISGGTFIDYDPSHSNSENPEENFCVSGYKVEKKDNAYTVVSAINYTAIKDLLDNNSDKLGTTITATPSSKYFLVKGTFVEFQSTSNGTTSSKQYGNLYIQDENGNKILVRGINTVDGKRFDATGIEGLTDIAVGDEIVVYGPAQTYNNTPQLTSTLLAVWKDTRYLSSDALFEAIAPADETISNLTLDSRATWVSNNEAIAISGTTGTVTRGTADVPVTLTATLLDPFTGENVTKDYTVVVKAAAQPTTKVATFDLGTDGTAGTHKDGSSIENGTGAIEATDNGYTLKIGNPTLVYNNALDKTGKGAIKLGTGKAAGSFVIDITGQTVKKIVIRVANYKANTGLVVKAHNGSADGNVLAQETISKLSDNGEYQEFAIEIPEGVTNVYFVCTVQNRCMIDGIDFYA